MNLSDAVLEVFKGVPRWKLASFALLAIFAAVYLYWSIARTRSPEAGAVTRPASAVKAEKVEGPKLRVPLKIVPAKAAQKTFPQIGTIAPSQPVVDTARIPLAENGGSTVTFMNVSTGVASTVFIPAPAPWFALESRNTLGAGYEASTAGVRVPIYYRRDILRVKDLHLVGEVGGKIPVGPGRIEGHAAGYVEWRF